MKELQVTLYEIFGYLVPGAISLAAVSILYWTFFVAHPCDLDSITTSGWWGLAAVSYVAGHLTQALTNNLFLRWRKPTVSLVLEKGSPLSLPQNVSDAAQEFACSIFKQPGGTALPPAVVYDVCDTFVQQKGKTESRDIYIYREGFYRGMFLATGLLAAAMIWRAFCQDSRLIVSGKFIHFSSWELVAFACVFAIASILFFQRYRRFGKYLIANSIYAALILKE
jgi:hypothetical protein